ncbi:MAG: hypothetical protein K0Q60_4560 [Microvirga sp.]|jgi:hypothetical protein|nr:hypothetical protein [Microvirga sp.]
MLHLASALRAWGPPSVVRACDGILTSPPKAGALVNVPEHDSSLLTAAAQMCSRGRK